MASNLKNTKSGYVYILSNTEVPDIIKIGEAIDAEERATTLSRQTGAFGEYKVVWKHKVEDNNQAVEKALHYKFREFSVHKEYFRIDKNKAIRIASQLVKDIKPLANSKAKQYQSIKQKSNKGKFKSASKSLWKEIVDSKSPAFVKDAIHACLKEGKIGQPQYRRFSAFRSNGATGIGRFDLYILKEHIRIGVTTESKIKAKRVIRVKLGNAVKTKDWEGGVTFVISNEREYKALVKWLSLGK